MESDLDHGVDADLAAEHLLDFCVPGRPLLCERAGFVFGVPGLQPRLLGQGDRLDRGRGPVRDRPETTRPADVAWLRPTGGGLTSARSTLR